MQLRRSSVYGASGTYVVIRNKFYVYGASGTYVVISALGLIVLVV